MLQLRLLNLLYKLVQGLNLLAMKQASLLEAPLSTSSTTRDN
jgi:hypothetical protein